MAGSHPREARALLGIRLHPVSGAQRGYQGSSSRNQSGRLTQPRQSAAGTPQRPASTPPQPLAVPGGSWSRAASFSWGGTPRDPTLPGGHRSRVSGRGHPGTRVPAPPGVLDFPITKGTLCLRRGQRGPSAPSLGTASSSPSAYPAGAPTSSGFMHAPSLLTNVGVSDPAASSSEARTPELAKPRLPEAGGGGEGGCGKGVVAAGPGSAAPERRT